MENINEKTYQKIPEEIKELGDLVFHKDNYLIRIWNIDERIPNDVSRKTNYICRGNLTLSNLEKGWEITGLVARGFCLVPREYDLTDTEKSAQDFSRYVCHELKYRKGIWMAQEPTKDFIYKGLEPFRERKIKLASLVEGVEFGSLNL
jgi:hypothetical protein